MTEIPHNDPGMPDQTIYHDDGTTTTVQDLPKGAKATSTKDADGNTTVDIDWPKGDTNQDQPKNGSSKDAPKNPAPKDEAPGTDKNDDAPTPPAPGGTPKDGAPTPPAPGDTPKNQSSGDAPKDAPNGDAPKTGDTKDAPKDPNFTSTYKPGDTVDDEMLDQLEAKGGKPSTVNGKRTVEMPDGTKYSKDQKLGKEDAARATENGVERPEKDTGNHYHANDEVTDAMAKDLKEQYDFTENEEGDLVSPDGKTVVPGVGGKLDQADADALAKMGVHKSTGYTSTNPNDANTQAGQADIAKNPALSADDAATYGYTGETGGEHPPLINKDSDKKNPVVYEYDTESGKYQPAGEVWTNSAGNDVYSEYTAVQKESIEKGEAIPGLDVWNPKYY